MPDSGLSKDSLRNLVSLTGEFVGTTDTLTLTNKTVVLEDNTIKQTTPSLGALLVDNGTKVVARARPAANLPLHGNSGGTDIEYSKLEVAGGGTGATSLTGVVIGTGTTAMTVKTNPTGAFLGDSDTQNITGAKTFTNQTLLLRNPAGTFSMTINAPAITAAKDYRFNSGYAYYIFKDGSTYYAKNGFTKGIDFSGSAADTVIQAAVTVVLSLAKGGLILFSADDFPINTPIDIPTVTAPKPLYLMGVPTYTRTMGTVFSVGASFPTGHYLFETSGATDTSTKLACVHMENVGGYNTSFATIDAGFLKFESDSVSLHNALRLENIFTQYMWRGIHLIGSVWWGTLKNLTFSNANSTFVGDADIKMENGSHTGVTNKWPKNLRIDSIFADHGGGSGGNLKNSLAIIDGSYNYISNYTIEGTKYQEAPIALTGQANNNIFNFINAIDLSGTPSPDNRTGSLYLSGTNCYDNHFYDVKMQAYPTYTLAIKSGAFRNTVEMAGYWGNQATIDDTGAGISNVVKILPGAQLAASATAKVTTTAALVRIIDERFGAYTTGVSTQSGNGSTVTFNIAHGCYTTPLTYSVTPQTADATGAPVITATSTNLVVTYPVAPPSGSSNLIFVWTAGVY